VSPCLSLATHYHTAREKSLAQGQDTFSSQVIALSREALASSKNYLPKPKAPLQAKNRSPKAKG
jgi:hypothetical protein